MPSTAKCAISRRFHKCANASLATSAARRIPRAQVKQIPFEADLGRTLHSSCFCRPLSGTLVEGLVTHPHFSSTPPPTRVPVAAVDVRGKRSSCAAHRVCHVPVSHLHSTLRCVCARAEQHGHACLLSTTILRMCLPATPESQMQRAYYDEKQQAEAWTGPRGVASDRDKPIDVEAFGFTSPVRAVLRATHACSVRDGARKASSFVLRRWRVEVSVKRAYVM